MLQTKATNRDPRAGWALLLPAVGVTARATGQAWQCVPVDDRLVLGRDVEHGVAVPGMGVAERHCRVQVAGGRLQAVDLGSEAGTSLRGRRLDARPTELAAGDVLRLGRVPVVVVRCRTRNRRHWLEMGGLGSATPGMWQALAELALSAATDFPLLLHGESGCGKELAARVVHERSVRADAPWLAVNCATLHGDTLLAELFGAARGAYTGSVEARRGAFERADGGTLFLDEIGELPPAAQAALLRVLEVGEVQVLGGAVKKVDVRLVCATHRDLRQEVAAGRFRLDLLHRLMVAEVRLPPLRERPADLVPLLEDHLDGLPVPRGAQAVLAAHPFAGNVRELRNIARRLQIGARLGDPDLADLRAALGPEVLYRIGEPDDRALGCGVADSRPARPGRSGHVDVQARCEQVADLLDREASTAAAWRRSGLPRGTFFRYARRVREAGLQPGSAF